MPVGELVFANVVDDRVWAVDGEGAAPGLYLVGSPGRALPFTMYRAWKVPTGVVSEEVQFYGPSGRLVYRWGPHVRRMLGSMDLTIETDRVADAHFDETGAYLASFVLEGEIVGEVELPVYVQTAAAKLPREVEDGFRKSDVIWVGVEVNGTRRSVPAWFAYRNGKVYVLSKREPGPEEQSIPGLPGAHELIITTRRKGRETALDEFPAAVRLLEGPEWEEIAMVLVDRRRSRVGPPADSLNRWRGTCDIAELTPLVV
jgi:hypothetical protein